MVFSLLPGTANSHCLLRGEVALQDCRGISPCSRRIVKRVWVGAAQCYSRRGAQDTRRAEAAARIACCNANGLPARRTVETGRVVVPDTCPVIMGGWFWEFCDGRCRRRQTSIVVHVAGALHAVSGDDTAVADVSEEESFG